MKIALIQQTATPDKSVNIKKGLKAFEKAANEGAKVIGFAELAFEPFYPQTESKGNNLDLSETIPGPTTNLFAEKAAKHGVVTVLNLYEKDGSNTYDSSPVIDADGTIAGTTRMIHITDYPAFHEKGYYAPGNNGAPVYETACGRIGVAICYDRHYPEYMRAMALNGAEIVFTPQAGAVDEWPEGLYEGEMQVAAFQNGYYAALCNRVGQEPHITFAGESFVCDPVGNIIAKAGKGTEEILYFDFDRKKVEDAYAKKLFLRDRRPELYSEWIGK